MSFHSPVTGIPQTLRSVLTAAAQVLLAAEDSATFIHTVYIVETTGNATTVFLDITNGVTTYRLTGTRNIAANGDLWLTVEQHLEPGWSLRATASVPNRLHTHVTHALGS